MIPIRDINPTRTRPVVVWVLIGLNALVWLYEYSLGDHQLGLFIERWGVVPFYLTQDPTLGSFLTPVTSMFLHGGWMHLIGNLWFLHVFGDNIEDALGKGRFLALYLLSGLGAAALQVAINPSSPVPMVGASGAIAGVLGAYLLLYPRARVITLVPIFLFIQFVELPAWVFLFVWFGLQLLQGVLMLGGLAGGVAFFAHVGGFLVGMALIHLLRRPPRTKVERGRRVVRPELRRAPPRIDSRRHPRFRAF